MNKNAIGIAHSNTNIFMMFGEFKYAHNCIIRRDITFIEYNKRKDITHQKNKTLKLHYKGHLDPEQNAIMGVLQLNEEMITKFTVMITGNGVHTNKHGTKMRRE